MLFSLALAFIIILPLALVASSTPFSLITTFFTYNSLIFIRHLQFSTIIIIFIVSIAIIEIYAHVLIAIVFELMIRNAFVYFKLIALTFIKDYLRFN